MTTPSSRTLFNKTIRIKNNTYSAQQLYNLTPSEATKLEILALRDPNVKDEDLDIFMFVQHFKFRRGLKPFHEQSYHGSQFVHANYIATAKKEYGKVDYLTYKSLPELSRAKIERLKLHDAWKHPIMKHKPRSSPISTSPSSKSAVPSMPVAPVLVAPTLVAPVVAAPAVKPTKTFPQIGKDPEVVVPKIARQEIPIPEVIVPKVVVPTVPTIATQKDVVPVEVKETTKQTSSPDKKKKRVVKTQPRTENVIVDLEEKNDDLRTVPVTDIPPGVKKVEGTNKKRGQPDEFLENL